MARRKQRSAVKEQVEFEDHATQLQTNQETTISDIEQLREILYGNQARTTDERLDRLERQLDSIRQQLNDTFTERIDNLRDSSQEQLTKFHKELVNSVDLLDKTKSEKLQETHTEFDAKLKQQAVELKTANKDFSVAVEQLSADFDQRNKQTQKEFREQIEQLGKDIRERLHSYKEEAQKRDDDLRQEFMALAAWLDTKKTSRHDLGHMLIDIGQRLQQEKESSLDDQEKK